MILANEVKRTRFHAINYIYLLEFSVDVLVEPLDEVAFSLFDKGQILGVRVACDSDNYSFSLRDRPGLVIPNVHEILRYIQIDQTLSDDTLTTYFETMNNDKLLYAVIDNSSSASIGTTVTFQFTVQNL